MTRGAEGGGEGSDGESGNNGEGGSSNGESGNNGESGSSNGETSGESGEGGGGNSTPRDSDPVRDDSIPRPPRTDDDRDRRRKDNDYVWPIPEINPPTVRINASGGYGTEVRPSGSSRVAETTLGVSGGATVLPTLEIGNFNS